MTRSKNNICSDDKNHINSSMSDEEGDDEREYYKKLDNNYDEFNDLIMTETKNSKSSIVGQLVGCVIVRCDSFVA